MGVWEKGVAYQSPSGFQQEWAPPLSPDFAAYPIESESELGLNFLHLHLLAVSHEFCERNRVHM